MEFQSAPPVRGATLVRVHPVLPAHGCFNPRPPCGGRRPLAMLPDRGADVSIRAPRAGGDLPGPVSAGCRCRFNPRPPCGGRHLHGQGRIGGQQFQSAPPVRGATRMSAGATSGRRFQSAPPVRGATVSASLLPRIPQVSIRAPRAGGDVRFKCAKKVRLPFQSAPPVRGATFVDPDICGPLVFQSAPPVRGATGDLRVLGHGAEVSIRAPRAGGDRRPSGAGRCRGCFNPRPPCGGRPSTLIGCAKRYLFQSAPPVRGATSAQTGHRCPRCSFNPRPPCGGRHDRPSSSACS